MCSLDVSRGCSIGTMHFSLVSPVVEVKLFIALVAHLTNYAGSGQHFRYLHSLLHNTQVGFLFLNFLLLNIIEYTGALKKMCTRPQATG